MIRRLVARVLVPRAEGLECALGLALVVAGVAMLSVAAAFIIAGLALLGFTLWPALRRR